MLGSCSIRAARSENLEIALVSEVARRSRRSTCHPHDRSGAPTLACVKSGARSATRGTGGLDVIRKKAWPFYRTISGVRLCWELEEAKGPKGCRGAGGGPLTYRGDLLPSQVAQGNHSHQRQPWGSRSFRSSTHSVRLFNWESRCGGCCCLNERPGPSNSFLRLASILFATASVSRVLSELMETSAPSSSRKLSAQASPPSAAFPSAVQPLASFWLRFCSAQQAHGCATP